MRHRSHSEGTHVPDEEGVLAKPFAPPVAPDFQRNEPDTIPQETFEKVERAKREWEATADSLSDLICMLDEAGHVLRANRVVEAWGLGRVLNVKGRLFHQMLHPSCSDPSCRLEAFLAQALENSLRDQPEELECYDEILQRFILVRVRPVQEKHNVASRTSVVVVQDITERKQAEEALQSYTARLEIMNEIGQAILAARSPEQIAQAALSRIRRLVPYRWASVSLLDPQSGRLVVLAADAVDGETAASLVLPQPQESVSVSVPLVVENEMVGRIDLQAFDTLPLSHEHIAIARETAGLLAVAVFQAHLFRQLQQANRELREAVQARDQMIQNVSHELRTPLTIIVGYTELLSEGGLGPMDDAQGVAIRTIDTQSHRLNEMVNNLLTLQSLNARRISKMSFDLCGLILQVARQWQVRFVAAGVEVGVDIQDELPDVLADIDLLTQVLYNLLDNALKFGPQGQVVTIRAYVTKTEHVLSITDQGIGISPEKLEKVFDHFYQVDGGANRTYGGMGIGLALCRKITEAHGGRIWAFSRGEGYGSTFYVALPFAQSGSCASLVSETGSMMP